MLDCIIKLLVNLKSKQEKFHLSKKSRYRALIWFGFFKSSIQAQHKPSKEFIQFVLTDEYHPVPPQCWSLSYFSTALLHRADLITFLSSWLTSSTLFSSTLMMVSKEDVAVKSIKTFTLRITPPLWSISYFFVMFWIQFRSGKRFFSFYQKKVIIMSGEILMQIPRLDTRRANLQLRFESIYYWRQFFKQATISGEFWLF